MGKLTATKVKAFTEPGTYMDGDGLMVVVTPKSSASWELRAMVAGKRRDIGLGSPPCPAAASACSASKRLPAGYA